MIAMSEPCANALEALKVLLVDPNSYNPFCIGTSEMFWKKIETEGLTPQVCSAGGICTDSTYEDLGGRNLDRVWIGRKGNKMCSAYARRAVKKSAGNPLNITFNAQLNESGMRPSKDYADNDGFDAKSPDLSEMPQAFMRLNAAKSVCSPEAIQELLEALPDWSKSLIAQKSANYVSLVAVNPISVESLYHTEPIKEQWND
jgi:hypothetical protein